MRRGVDERGLTLVHDDEFTAAELLEVFGGIHDPMMDFDGLRPA